MKSKKEYIIFSKIFGSEINEHINNIGLEEDDAGSFGDIASEGEEDDAGGDDEGGEVPEDGGDELLESSEDDFNDKEEDDSTDDEDSDSSDEEESEDDETNEDDNEDASSDDDDGAGEDDSGDDDYGDDDSSEKIDDINAKITELLKDDDKIRTLDTRLFMQKIVNDLIFDVDSKIVILNKIEGKKSIPDTVKRLRNLRKNVEQIKNGLITTDITILKFKIRMVLEAYKLIVTSI